MITIDLCMGSSCFARGNKDALPLITELLDERSLADCVALKGHLCAESCSQGPHVVVNGQVYQGLTPESALDVIAYWLGTGER